jgi:hypothetical protein
MTASLDVDHTPFHREQVELAEGVDEVRRSPSDSGVVELITVRPTQHERRVLDSVEVDPERGAIGDNWQARGSARTADGGPNPEAQVTVMNSRAVQLVAGSRERWQLAGDQLFVDLDLSPENLPTGTRLLVGDAELEVTASPHTGCAQFSARFGVAALRLTATPEGRALRLRGINTRVVRGGTVSTGDVVEVQRPT